MIFLAAINHCPFRKSGGDFVLLDSPNLQQNIVVLANEPDRFV